MEVKEQVGYIKMNRPQKRNALSEGLVRQLIDSLKELEQDPNVKIIILSGEGPAFSAGGDIAEMGTHENVAQSMAWMKRASALTKTIIDLDKYVVASVHGFAAGAGFSLALAADFVIADKSTKFVCSFTNIGLIPDLGLTKLLADRLPLAIIKEWIATGKPIPAEVLYEKGLINRLAEQDVLKAAEKFSEEIISGPPLSHLFGKKLVHLAGEMNFDSVLVQESIAQILLTHTQDHAEGTAAFLEKRVPEYKGS
ncbi:enoyl-CoA hydratase/isomerase family protein [Planococcus salinus]|uniref:Enoyl-CoA hydratase/isomerase family protein n=2 Tax=Planococcus salinus TaxID=1848460 RepID=A0A3M8P9I4_9BACL|nr:enoyl-CoA hydratase/isomerase family protein [Planococcus salinus]